MNGARRESIVIVGPGRAGTALGRMWQAAGHAIAGIVGGGAESTAAARAVLGLATPALRHGDALAAGTLVVVAVPDDRLDEAARQLAAGGPGAAGTIVIHLCGARGADALDPVRSAGVRTAAFHPLHAFPTRNPVSPGLGGSLCAVESADADRARMFELAHELGAAPFALAAQDRALYHAGAAAAGNGVLALLDLALRALQRAGVPPEIGRPALVALAKGALDNAAAMGPAAALTGPVVRGDREVIARHLAALDAFSPVDQRFYWAVVRALIRLASRRPDGWKALQVASAVEGLEQEGDA